MTSRCSAGRSIVAPENPPRTVKRLFPRVLGQEPYLTTVRSGRNAAAVLGPPRRHDHEPRHGGLLGLSAAAGSSWHSTCRSWPLASWQCSLQGAYLGDEEGDRARERRV